MKLFIKNDRGKFHKRTPALFAVVAVAALLLCSTVNGFAQAKEITYTLDDRDRMIRVEEQIKSLREEMNTLREEMNNNINKLYTLIYFVLGGVFGLIGLVLWDRRSYIKPVKEDIEALRNVLRMYAEKNPELKEILKNAAI